VEGLARCWVLRRLQPPRGDVLRQREDAWLDQLQVALQRAAPLALVKTAPMPPPKGSIDETAAAALGVPTAAEYHASPFAALPRSGPMLKAALGAAYLLWPTLRTTKEKFDAALTVVLADTDSAAPTAVSNADVLAALRHWRAAVAVLWAHAGSAAAFELCSEAVQAQRAISAVARHHHAHEHTPHRAVPLGQLIKAQAAARRWLARGRVRRVRREGDSDAAQRLRRLFAACCKHFAGRRDAAARYIDAACTAEATQRRVDDYWAHEETDFRRQWSSWEQQLRRFYLQECPVDPNDWAFDGKRHAEGGRDVFVNVHTGRHQEEHPNTNKLVAARTRELHKATKAREARQADARRQEDDASRLYTSVAEPAWRAMAEAPPPFL
jgi:hypothetical protein